MPLRSAASPAALRTIREAFEDLERAVTPADAKEFGNTTLQNVQKAALEIENRMGARKSLRNMRRIMPFFTGLGHYAKTIEVLCNGTPYLPWIWAPIKLILTVASDFVDAFDTIIKHYSRISESLSRFEILKDAFRNNTEFQNVLAVYYCDILKFHKAAYRFIRQRSWALFFDTSFGRFKSRFDDIIANLKSHEHLLDLTANAINISEAREIRIRLEQHRKDQLDAIAKEEKRKTSQQYEEIVAWLKVDPSEQVLILDSVMEEAFKFSSGCDWVTKVDRIMAWMQRNDNEPFVWLQGKPGSGKSVLAGHIIGFLQGATRADHSVLVSHFCTYSYASSTKYDLILRSLLLQILQANADLVAYVFRLKETDFAMRAPTSKSLEQLLRTVASAVPQTPGEVKHIHLILDGLDECESEKQGQLINLLGQLVATRSAPPNSARYKVLVLSRNTSFLTKRLRKRATVVSLTDEAQQLEKAIRSYAYSKLGALRSRLTGMGIGDADIRDMATAIAQKADGMYIWARLVIEYISNNMFYNKDEILHAAQELPSELGAFYERILTQILGNFDTRSTERLKSIFGWIAYAKRPLRMFEFQSALAFGPGDPMVANVPPSYLFSMCAPLIEERRDSTFAFIHVSVKDYLKSRGERSMISEETAYYEHGTATITCLLSGLTVFDSAYSTHDRNRRVLRGLHAFHVYSNEFWLDHVLPVMASTQKDPASSLYALMSQLASKLLELDSRGTLRPQTRDTATLDSDLECLKTFEGLYTYAKIVKQARSAKSLEEKSRNQGAAEGSEAPPDTLSAALSLYQSTVQSLLALRTFPSTSMEDLERFKKSHRTSAFTCRLNGCARSTIGFENDQLRTEHEKTHVSRLYCQHPGCPYPPFSSDRTLRNHIAKCHDDAHQEKPRRSIRAHATQQPSRLRGQDLESDHPMIHAAPHPAPINRVDETPLKAEPPDPM